MSERKSGGWGETLRTVFWAILIAFAIRIFAYEPFSIPSGSMIPTLLIGDYLFVSKFSYGYSRYSLPGGLPLIPGRVLADSPERGDVVVFKFPGDNSTDFIKRIVGLPGDRIQVINGLLHINGEAVQRERVTDYVEEYADGRYRRFPRYIETLPNGRSHYIIEETDQGPMDNTQVYVVPEGHYFGMGDNRDRSRDSRDLGHVGYIPEVNLVGRAEFLFFSVDGAAWKFWKWGNTVRTERIFDDIQ